MKWNVAPDDTLTLKVIGNRVNGALSNRLSLNQYYLNPYQKGCTFAASAAAGCQIASFYINGYNGAKQPLSPDEAGLNRNDTRTIVGVRWERRFDANTTWRTQFVVDDRNINQPTGTTSAIGDYPSYNLMTDITSHGQLFGLNATQFLGLSFNTLSDIGDTYNVVGTPGTVVPLGSITTGGLTTKVYSSQQNLAIRGREELQLTDAWTFVAGLGIERSNLKGWSKGWTYTAPSVPTATSPSYVSAQQNVVNAAPEVALRYRPADEWQFRGRIATAYVTPQVSQLFVLPTGLPGNNTGLVPEKDLGFDLGADWMPNSKIKVSVTGFYEFLRDELRSQATPVGAPSSSYTFNVPASEHRGIEASVNWRFLEGWQASAAYTYDNQIFTKYNEVLTGAGTSSAFSRTGNRLPGVPPQTLYAKLGYEQETGPLKGLEAYVEYYHQSSFFMDNANLLSAPGYQLVNINVHWTKDIDQSVLKSFSTFAEIRNIFNTTYVSSANNIADTLIAANTQAPAATLASTAGSIYAGTPRTVIAGMKVKF